MRLRRCADSAVEDVLSSIANLTDAAEWCDTLAIWRLRFVEEVYYAPRRGMTGKEHRVEYRQFERLIIGVTAALVVGTIAVSLPRGGETAVEVAAQIAIVLVVAGASHWGRKGGTICALVASIAYLAASLPIIANNLTGPSVYLVVSRIAGYLLLGIVGGEIFGRVKYVFAGMRDAGTIDHFSRVFSERFAADAVRQALARADRYDEPFSLVFVTLEPQFTGNARTKRMRALVRSVANVIRDDVRIVDDVAHLADGRFVVLLPYTSATGARVVAARLVTAIGSAHGTDQAHVVTECLAAPENGAAIEAFRRQLGAPEVDALSYPGSGA